MNLTPARFPLATLATGAASGRPEAALRRWRIPWTTLIIAALALLLQASPESFQYDRSDITAGQWWRLVSGHLTHWSSDHLAWDLLTFLALGITCEQVSRAATLRTCLSAPITISAWLLLVQPSLLRYRGLSGIDSALFGLLAVELLHPPKLRVVAGVALVAFAGKVVFELLAGRSFFVDSAAAAFVPVPSAHLVGLSAGSIAGWLRALGRAREKRGSI